MAKRKGTKGQTLKQWSAKPGGEIWYKLNRFVVCLYHLRGSHSYNPAMSDIQSVQSESL